MSAPRRVEAGEVRGGEPDLMTVGELARRTGLSRKLIREFEGLGLIYSAGRSEAGYRLFDQPALWCVTVIGNLRSLGLTLKDIRNSLPCTSSNRASPSGRSLPLYSTGPSNASKPGWRNFAPSRTASPRSEPKTRPCSPAQMKPGSSATTHADRRRALDLHPGVRP
jgi:DNA-binding transcriptional MerR regulator